MRHGVEVLRSGSALNALLSTLPEADSSLSKASATPSPTYQATHLPTHQMTSPARSPQPSPVLGSSLDVLGSSLIVLSETTRLFAPARARVKLRRGVEELDVTARAYVVACT